MSDVWIIENGVPESPDEDVKLSEYDNKWAKITKDERTTPQFVVGLVQGADVERMYYTDTHGEAEAVAKFVLSWYT